MRAEQLLEQDDARELVRQRHPPEREQFVGALELHAERATDHEAHVPAGLAIPFLVTAVAFTRATTAFRWMRDRYLIITAVSGLVLIAMGYLLLTGQLTDLNIEAQRLLNEIGLGDLYNL